MKNLNNNKFNLIYINNRKTDSEIYFETFLEQLPSNSPAEKKK